MRETEMRRRTDAVLKASLHKLLLPTLGLGLAVGGCTNPQPVYGAQLPLDAGEADAVRDAATPLDTAIDSAASVDGAGPVDAPVAVDSSSAIEG